MGDKRKPRTKLAQRPQAAYKHNFAGLSPELRPNHPGVKSCPTPPRLDSRQHHPSCKARHSGNCNPDLVRNANAKRGAGVRPAPGRGGDRSVSPRPKTSQISNGVEQLKSPEHSRVPPSIVGATSGPDNSDKAQPTALPRPTDKELDLGFGTASSHGIAFPVVESWEEAVELDCLEESLAALRDLGMTSELACDEPRVSRKELDRRERGAKALAKKERRIAKYSQEKTNKGKEKEDSKDSSSDSDDSDSDTTSSKASSDSQPATGASTPSNGTLKVLAPSNELVCHIPQNTTPEQAYLLMELVPECRFVKDAQGAAHNHLVAHFSRQALAGLLIRTIVQSHKGGSPPKILCIGLKPSHTRLAQNFGALLHHNVSAIAARDSFRYKRITVPNSCRCQIDVPCPHFSPDYTILWDRVYYMDLKKLHSLLKLTTTATVYSAHSVFEGHRGGFWAVTDTVPAGRPEFVYVRDNKGDVTVHQCGSRHGHYAHSAADWMSMASSELMADGLTVGWDALYSRKSLEVLEFMHIDAEVMPDGVHSPAYDWIDDTYYGQMAFRQGTMPTLDTDCALGGSYSVGKDIIVDVAGERIVVSKTLISRVSQFAQGQPITDSLMKDCIRAARGYIRTVNMPEHELSAQLSLAAALGIHHAVISQHRAQVFLREVAESAAELDPSALAPLWGHRLKDGRLKNILHKLCTWFRIADRDTHEARGALHEALAEVARFFLGKGLRNSVAAWGIMAPIFAGFSSGSLNLKQIYESFSMIFQAGLWICPVVDIDIKAWLRQCVHTITAYFRRFREQFWAEVKHKREARKCDSPVEKELSDELVSLFEDVDIGGLSSGVSGNNDPAHAYCAGDRYRDQEIETKHGAYHTTHEENMEECELKKPPLLIGIGFKDMPTFVDSGCVHNVAAAITGRVLSPLDDPSPGYWADMPDFMDKLYGPAYENAICVDFNVWVKRFPVAKRRNLIVAREKVYSFPESKENTHSTLFVKRQCDVAPDGVIPDHDPRAIQARPFEEMAALGPITYSASKALCAGSPHGRNLDGSSFGGITYAPGLTAEGIDLWLADAEMLVDGEIVYIMCDATRLDSSVHRDSHEAYYKHMNRHFEADSVQQRIQQAGIKIVGHAGGQQFGIDRGEESGHVKTTHSNSKKVGAVVAKALRWFQRASAIVSGDDVAIVALASEAKAVITSLQIQYKHAGFRPKLAVSRHRVDMEFCSGRFWSAANEHGFAYGPKPGKLLPKLFSSIVDHAERKRPQLIQGICLSMKQSVAHLPVAREFIAQHEDLTVGATPLAPLGSVKGVFREGPSRMSQNIWDDYQHVYGVSKADCMLAIKAIQGVTKLPVVLDLPLLRTMYDIDIVGAAGSQQDPTISEECGLTCGSLTQLSNFFESKAPTTFLGRSAWSILTGAALLATCYLESAALKSGVNIWVRNGIIAPLLEETARALLDGTTRRPYFTAQIILHEARANFPLYGWRAVPALGMHCVNFGLCAALGPSALLLTVPIHSLFNLVATYTQVRPRSARIAPGYAGAQANFPQTQRLIPNLLLSVNGKTKCRPIPRNAQEAKLPLAIRKRVAQSCPRPLPRQRHVLRWVPRHRSRGVHRPSRQTNNLDLSALLPRGGELGLQHHLVPHGNSRARHDDHCNHQGEHSYGWHNRHKPVPRGCYRHCFGSWRTDFPRYHVHCSWTDSCTRFLPSRVRQGYSERLRGCQYDLRTQCSRPSNSLSLAGQCDCRPGLANSGPRRRFSRLRSSYGAGDQHPTSVSEAGYALSRIAPVACQGRRLLRKHAQHFKLKYRGGDLSPTDVGSRCNRGLRRLDWNHSDSSERWINLHRSIYGIHRRFQYQWSLLHGLEPSVNTRDNQCCLYRKIPGLSGGRLNCVGEAESRSRYESIAMLFDRNIDVTTRSDGEGERTGRLVRQCREQSVGLCRSSISNDPPPASTSSESGGGSRRQYGPNIRSTRGTLCSAQLCGTRWSNHGDCPKYGRYAVNVHAMDAEQRLLLLRPCPQEEAQTTLGKEPLVCRQFYPSKVYCGSAKFF